MTKNPPKLKPCQEMHEVRLAICPNGWFVFCDFCTFSGPIKPTQTEAALAWNRGVR